MLASLDSSTAACLALALSATALVACFVHPDDSVKQMVCSTDKNCPLNYRCNRQPGNATGTCVASSAETSGGVLGNGSGGAAGSSGDAVSGENTDSGGPSQSGGVGGGADAPQAGGAGGARPDAEQTSSASGGGIGYGGDTLGAGGSSGGIPGGGGTSGQIDAPATGGAIGTGGAVTGSGGAASTGGATGAGECTPGTHNCSGDTLLTCDNDGRWPTEGSACPNVCRSNACSGQCKPGTYSCSGDTLLTCDAAGNWPTTGSACEFVCRNNACSGQCKPGTNSCSKDTLLTCDADGNWPTAGSACPYVCLNNACTGECRLGDIRCSNNMLEFCQPDGTYQGDKPCDSNTACNAARRACVCTLTTCGTACSDTSVDSRNCGKCNYACPGKCIGSVCQCATQSASNLVKNGGFDTDSLEGWWTPGDTTISRASLDSTGCAGSGSLLATSVTGSYVYSPCISVTPSSIYNAGGWVNCPSPSDTSITIEWYSSADCSDPGYLGEAYSRPEWVDSVWNHIAIDARAPPTGTVSARLWLTFPSGTQTYFDALYLSPQPSYF